ncbi:hypothetical protein CEE69_31450 [Rhodopirellula bahusiensis]|uniref:Uncharacterized protein n=1 Tax=Rhodopirellula bahusiensis TaxID=2014065 RepID=A0A2G1VX66_9BACT|nr:hypothetical protein CEE69_31450 [Rhodopirellula bahusiensis]
MWLGLAYAAGCGWILAYAAGWDWILAYAAGCEWILVYAAGCDWMLAYAAGWEGGFSGWKPRPLGLQNDGVSDLLRWQVG